ncbi:phage major capsid protein [Micromonospora sp. PTRAS2]
MNYVELANAAIEKRDRAFEQLKTVHADSALSAADRDERAARINAEIDALGAEAEGHIRAAERVVEHRELNARAATLAGGRADRSEWRSLFPSQSEWRGVVNTGTPGEGGYTVPTKVSSTAIGMLSAESVFLRGLPKENVHLMDSEAMGAFQMPQVLSSDDPDYVTEGDSIGIVDTQFGSKLLKPFKFGEIMLATAEILDDSQLDLRQLLADIAVRKLAEKVDRDLFSGTGTASLNGIIGQGQSTTLGAGVKITHDAIADGMAAIEAANGRPSVVWTSPTIAAQLRKERYAAGGEYVRGGPVGIAGDGAWGVPILVSNTLPAKTLVVADGSRAHVLIRKKVKMAESHDFLFADDKVAFRMTFRIAGVALAEAASCQVIKEA